MKTKLLIVTAFMITALFSCSKEAETDSQQQNITADETAANSKIDMANDDVSDIVAEQEAATYGNSTNAKYANTDSARSSLTDCAAISRNPDFGTTITPGTTVTKTIDFKTGCTLANGNVLKGKIIISFVYQPNATEHTITYTFDNFYHNAIKFNGTKTFTRTIVNNLPVITMNMDLTATFPDGRVFTRVGQRIREFVSGHGDSDWTNNVYKVTGSWTTTSPNASVLTSTISNANPLLIKMSCATQHKAIIVKGLITFTRDNHTATLDYGNGECDTIAHFTINGLVFEINIGH